MKYPLYSFVFILLIYSYFFPNTVCGQDPKITYTVSMPFPSNHLFEVEISIENYSSSPDNYIDLSLPAWRSGRYNIINFSSGVQDFSAEDETGSKLSWNKTDKDTWRVQGQVKNYKIKYKIFANEFSIRTKGLNDECGFIDASAVFIYAEKLRSGPLEVKVIPYGSWHVTTGLDRVSGTENTFSARDYDYLADCPLLIGDQKDYDFFVNDKKFVVSFPPDQVYDREKVLNDIKNISKAVCDFWGETPFEHFTYMLIAGSFDYGATEHLNSTVFSVSPITFTNKDRYYTFLSNCAHELFHTWNVKQLRPKEMDPYDFTKENYSGELWIAEGITSYYEYVFMLKTGYLLPDKFFEALSGNIKNDIERPGNYVQSLYESGFDAWIKHSGNAPNKFNAETDFYKKGANVGTLLDLEIRNSSENKYSLNDVMVKMYKNFPLNQGGYTNEDFIKVCEEYNGKSLTAFFNKYLYGLDSLDWKKYLNYAGLDLIITYDPAKPSIGISTRESGDRLYVSGIIPGSPAYESGLDLNDEIIALNGYKVRSSTLNSRISDMQDGDEVKITVMRDDKLREFIVTLKGVENAKYKVEKITDPDELQKKIYEKWVNSNW
ncbi:MAG: M61 family metallopeptidase [Ignavibacteria bacterium]|nr:M61 family metallopeptidase [Ignavibacteria bacterium]